MVATTNLNMEHWVASQSQPEVNHNVNLDIVDGKLAGAVTVDANGDADYTLATTGTPPYEWQHAYIELTNGGTAWTAQHNLNVPAEGSYYCVYNNNGSGYNVNVQVTGGGGAGVTVADGAVKLIYCDGTDCQQISNATEFKDVVFGFYVPGAPTDALECLRLTMTHAVTFPSGLTGSQSKASTASTGTVAFSVKKNGTEFGTITFTTSATGTFAAASATSLAIGDQLTVVAPATADSTLADIGISLLATRD